MYMERFLKVNGHVVPVEIGSLTETFEYIGSYTRSVGGIMFDGVRNRRKVYNLKTSLMRENIAEQLRKICEGQYHHIDFSNGNEGSTGIRPSSYLMSSCVVDPDASTPYNTNGSTVVGGNVAYDIQSDDWTVFGNLGGKPFFLDNDNTTATGVIATHSAGEVNLNFTVLDDLCNLVIFPYRLDDVFFAEYSYDKNRYGPAPLVAVTGRLFDGEAKNCHISVDEISESEKTGFVTMSLTIRGGDDVIDQG